MSGRAAGLERRQPLSNVDRGAQLTIDAIDPGVEPPDFGDDFVTQRIDPCDDTVVEPVDLLVQSGDLHGEARVHAIDLRAQTRVDAGDLLVDADDPLIQDANVATDRAELGRDDVLERRFDLIVNAHGLHSSRPSLIGQCLIWNTRGAPATKPAPPGDFLPRDLLERRGRAATASCAPAPSPPSPWPCRAGCPA